MTRHLSALVLACKLLGWCKYATAVPCSSSSQDPHFGARRSAASMTICWSSSLIFSSWPSFSKRMKADALCSVVFFTNSVHTSHNLGRVFIGLRRISIRSFSALVRLESEFKAWLHTWISGKSNSWSWRPICRGAQKSYC